jgi:hypothetical protein
VSELGKGCTVPVVQRLFGGGGGRSSSCAFAFYGCQGSMDPGGNWGLDISMERCYGIELLGEDG